MPPALPTPPRGSSKSLRGGIRGQPCPRTVGRAQGHSWREETPVLGSVCDARRLFARPGLREHRGCCGDQPLPGPPLGPRSLRSGSRHRQAPSLPDAAPWRQPALPSPASVCGSLQEVASGGLCPGGFEGHRGPGGTPSTAGGVRFSPRRPSDTDWGQRLDVLVFQMSVI